MELEIEKEEKKSQKKKDEISHRVNETIRSRNHDALLKQRQKEQKLKERSNRFRECGERMGGTNILAVQPGHHAGVSTPIAFDDPNFDGAVESYLEGKASKLVKGIIRKHKAAMAAKSNKKKKTGAVVTPGSPSKAKGKPSASPASPPPRRPKSVVEALRMCPEGWACFSVGDGFIFKNNSSGFITYDPPAAMMKPPPPSPVAVAQPVADDDNDSAPEVVADEVLETPMKSTGLDDDDDDDDDVVDDNNNVIDEFGNIYFPYPRVPFLNIDLALQKVLHTV